MPWVVQVDLKSIAFTRHPVCSTIERWMHDKLLEDLNGFQNVPSTLYKKQMFSFQWLQMVSDMFLLRIYTAREREREKQKGNCCRLGLKALYAWLLGWCWLSVCCCVCLCVSESSEIERWRLWLQNDLKAILWLLYFIIENYCSMSFHPCMNYWHSNILRTCFLNIHFAIQWNANCKVHFPKCYKMDTSHFATKFSRFSFYFLSVVQAPSCAVRFHVA